MDIWGTLKAAVTKVGVPMLANAIIPGSGGFAASLIGNALGVDPNNPEEMLAAVQSASPDKLVELQMLQEENKPRLAEISAELDKAYLADRQNARARDEAFLKAGKTNSRANWMIAGDVVGLIVCLVVIYLLKDATGSGIGELRGLLTAIAGYFGLGLRDAHQFEFGSSRGSKDKDLKAQTGIPLFKI